MTRRVGPPLVLALVAAALVAAIVVNGDSGKGGTLSAAAAPVQVAATRRGVVPPVRHVFVINLENKGFDTTFGPGTSAPYLSQTLRNQGTLLSQYYGVAHNSLPNYIAEISGQAPNPQTQADCQIYSDFVGLTTVAPQQAVGQGCVYPVAVKTIADQLTGAGLTWKGYMEDMGNTPGQATTCRHPVLDTPDGTQTATPTDQYAARHNPFVYFHSVIDSPACAVDDVPLTGLPTDLARTDTTANLTFITPNLCHDGHDAPCANGEAGGLTSADAFLKSWVPKILASPAYKADGLLVVTFDESGSPQSDATACCGESAGPNSPLPGIAGKGGGRVGAVLTSKWIKPGSFNDTPYNHYALLGSIEDIFGVPHLGDAATVPYRFARDVFDNYR